MQSTWFIYCYGHNFRTDTLVLDNQLRGSSLGKTICISCSQNFLITCSSLGMWSHEISFVHVSKAIGIVQALFRQANCWGNVGETTLTFLGNNVTTDFWVFCLLQSFLHYVLSYNTGISSGAGYPMTGVLCIFVSWTTFSLFICSLMDIYAGSNCCKQWSYKAESASTSVIYWLKIQSYSWAT